MSTEMSHQSRLELENLRTLGTLKLVCFHVSWKEYFYFCTGLAFFEFSFVKFMRIIWHFFGGALNDVEEKGLTI